MPRSRRFTADISALTAALCAVVAFMAGLLGEWWLVAIPLSWLLASVAVVLSTIALIRRQRLWLALPALIIGAGAVFLPYLLSDTYIAAVVDTLPHVARWISTQ